MPKISWLWFLIGIAFAMFVIPMVTSMLQRSKVKTTQSRGA